MQDQLKTAYFEQQFKKLNASQQQAVETIEGPVLVLAGPGTGKTQVLALRIATILQKTDTAPENILALTFTESAAKNMRSRLVALMGKDGYFVRIETFHSFCAGVLTTHPEYFELPRDSTPLTDFERFSIVESVLDTLDLEILKPRRDSYFYVRHIQKALSDLKREGIDPLAFEKIVADQQQVLESDQTKQSKATRLQREKNLLKQHELTRVYQAYQQELHTRAKFDYDDMVMLVAQAFAKHEELLLEYQENILYFLVDEYQDTNSAQNALVDMLASYDPATANIFAVGDPNQAIYRFQGASLENVLGFVDRYPNAVVIGLSTGYRCSQPIYAAAASLLAQNRVSPTADLLAEPSEGRKKLTAELATATQLKSTHKGVLPVVVHQAVSQVTESLFVAEKITELLGSGVEPRDIAVLFRSNKESVLLSEVLGKWEVPYTSESESSVLELESIRQLCLLFSTIDSLRRGEEGAELYHVLQLEWLGVPSLVGMQISRAAHRARSSVYAVLSGGYETFLRYHSGPAVSPLEFSLAEAALAKLLEWAALDSRVSFLEWFSVVQKESGFLDWVMKKPEKVTELLALRGLHRVVQNLVVSNHDLRLQDFLSALATMREHGLSVPLESITSHSNAVTLSTVHKAKGQEWRFVFIVGLVDGAWGNSHSRIMLPLPEGILHNTDFSKKERNEDDRRLFFVALTRAKEQVFVSFSDTSVSDTRTKQLLPSMFITELGDHLQPLADDPDVAKTTVPKQLELLAMPAPKRLVSQSEREYLEHIVSEFKLSVSALNAYLQDPKEFFLHYILKVPQKPSIALGFGTALHAGLEKLYRELVQTGAVPAVSSLHTVFEQRLEQESVLSKDIKRELVHGKEVITTYHAKVVPTMAQQVVSVERFFGSGASVPLLENVVLTGRIDRVDWVDRSAQTVRLIDYKTGMIRSVADITATTKTALEKLSVRQQALPAAVRGPYKRQLLFYKLLTDLDHSFKPHAVEGVFEFVEPDKKTGVQATRVFSLEPEEVELLRLLIIEVMKEIRGLAFLDALK